MGLARKNEAYRSKPLNCTKVTNQAKCNIAEQESLTHVTSLRGSKFNWENSTHVDSTDKHIDKALL